MKLENLKGTKDFLPDSMFIKNKIVETLKKTFEQFGFEPLETPILEMYKVLSSKYAGGSEILKETYRLKDQGKRDLALRYDLTVPLARFIGMNPTLKFPFKRYEIGKVFRDGPIKTGRLREFWQCDVDTIGTTNMLSEAEIIALAVKVFKELDLKFTIEVNNRKVLVGLLELAGVEKKDLSTTVLSVDKLKKIGTKGVEKELSQKGLDKKVIKNIFKLTKEKSTTKQTIDDLLETLKEGEGREGASELKELFNLFKELDLQKNIQLNLTLARGLEIYTGTIFEGFLKNSKVTSSVCAGGRWDKIIGKFLDNGNEYPAVGISFGLEAIASALEENKEPTNVKVFIAPIGDTKSESFEIANSLREANINTDIDLLSRGPSKNLEYASSKGIEYVLLIGPKELEAKKFTLRNMKSGKQFKINLKEIIKKLS